MGKSDLLKADCFAANGEKGTFGATTYDGSIISYLQMSPAGLAVIDKANMHECDGTFSLITI